MRSSIVVLLLSASSTAFAASELDHDGVHLSLSASSSRPGDGSWVTEVTLMYRVERDTRVRVTRARIWDGERPRVVPHELGRGQVALGRRFVASGTGSVRVHVSAIAQFHRVELVVRFAGRRFVLRADVQRDSTPMPGEPPGLRETARPDPNAIRVRIDAPDELQRHLRRRLPAPRFARCFTGDGRAVAMVFFDEQGRVRDVRMQASGAVEPRCVESFLRRTRAPVGEERRARFIIENR